jgi:methylated-DNA-protein-cysteine methyltransferase-like protein
MLQSALRALLVQKAKTKQHYAGCRRSRRKKQKGSIQNRLIINFVTGSAVWSAAMGYFDDIHKTVRKIPRGKVATYGSVAKAAGYPGTARQVAWALRAPNATRLPWHRVLGSGGRILLPEEAGLHQRMLLELEGVLIKGNRVDLTRSEFRFK